MSLLIGIDLGTSTTEACVYRNGKKEMIPNLEGRVIIPSAIGLDAEGNWVVGERAKAQALLLPQNTAVEVKRKTGSGETIQLGKSYYKPVELQARLLSYVRNYASEYLQEDVVRAVISVPAYFNDIQRRETIQAGEMAGFTVERILNEPTAAALSYGLDHMEENSHVLVYDLGGGTFDVTLLEMFDGVLEVKASSGDNQLGGKDFDEKLMQELFRRFTEKYKTDISQDRYAQVKVKEEAEKCKIALSEQEQYHVLIPAIATSGGKPLELDEIVTKEEFEKLTRDLLERTHEPISRVLDDAGIDASHLDRIILVGGSSRMPMVHRDIQNFLKKEADPAVNPDFAVSEGTAIMSGIIGGEIDPTEGIIMTDVNPFTLGVYAVTDTSMDYMAVLIPRNTTIPVTRTETFYTSGDFQTEAKIEVYQGESEIASHNLLLGSFMLGGIPPRLQGEESLDVEFSYNVNGILDVRATITSTGKDASISIRMGGGKEIETDVSDWKNAPGASEYRTLIRTAERFKSRCKDQNLADKVGKLVYSLKEALILEREEEAKHAADEISTLLDEMREMK